MTVMLITGASKGIGRAFAEHFKDKYEIVTVARTGDVIEKGDLTDSRFRQHLVEKYTPTVFVNNAGIKTHAFMSTFETNVMAAGDLLSKFYHKMPKGDIINISSFSANAKGWDSISDFKIWYNASKRVITEMSDYLSVAKHRPIRVTSIEPNHVNTSFNKGKIYKIDYNEIGLDIFNPMPPSYIAEVADWILKQPPYVVISNIKIDNFYKKNTQRPI